MCTFAIWTKPVVGWVIVRRTSLTQTWVCLGLDMKRVQQTKTDKTSLCEFTLQLMVASV